MIDTEPVAIVGGGVIGLSLAWELCRRGRRVGVYDINRFGSRASWAGAGILVPANHRTMTQPLDRLLGYGSELHERWAAELRAETGVDNGYRRCGGLYIARSAGEKASLEGIAQYWRQYEIEFEEVPATKGEEMCAGGDFGPSARVIVVPAEGQIRNPDHLRALEAVCRKHGVAMMECCGPVRMDVDSRQRVELQVGGAKIRCGQICLCAGAWTSALLRPLEVTLPVIPVRGQMLLYKLPQQKFEPIINEGSRYIVPRLDGHVLVGSTMEEAGFDESTTAAGLDELRQFAARLIPRLEDRRLVNSWAGLRPASHDGFPFIGAIAGFENLFVATGHFKSGLQMSTATAVLLADRIEGHQPKMDLSPFAPNRLDAQSAPSRMTW